MSDGSYFSTTDPNQVFELVELLGEGSYGAVYKGVNKLNGDESAIKIIPSEEDMTQLQQEIDFLRRLKSPYVVSFIEGYLFDMELWIVMEYCAAGSMSDLYEATKTPLNEPQLRAVMAYCVLGLNHLHMHRSIHRDLKAGNILLTDRGVAKLADFGVSAQLTNTMQKRKTVIGTPFWMAPEVIQETSYDGRADVWSMGITALELCEGQPPHYNVHPMRAIFMIPMKPAPTLKDPALWSSDMIDFLGRCLVKKMEDRATTHELMEHPWVANDVEKIIEGGRGLPVLEKLVADNIDLIKRMRAGEEDSLTPATDDKNRTVDRAGSTAKRPAAQKGHGSLHATKNSLRRVAKETGVVQSPPSEASRPARATPPTVRRATGVDDEMSSRVESGTWMHSRGGEDFTGTMQVVGTMHRSTADPKRPPSTDMKAALKYFAASSRAEQVLPHIPEVAPADAQSASRSTESLGVQEIQRQLQELDRQYLADMEELKKAYNVKRQQLQGALTKFPLDVRAAEGRGGMAR